MIGQLCCQISLQITKSSELQKSTWMSDLQKKKRSILMVARYQNVGGEGQELHHSKASN